VFALGRLIGRCGQKPRSLAGLGMTGPQKKDFGSTQPHGKIQVTKVMSHPPVLRTSLSFRVKIEDMRLEVLSLVWRLDCLSCVLTVLSTILIGRRCWTGWVLAAVNSLIICVIGLRTGQLGLIPANLFCIVLYAVNLRTWRKAEFS
jgi:hypothetical protein